MLQAKTLADTLTTIRVFMAAFILWLGVTQGAQDLPLAVVALVIGWATDLVDGPLARRDPNPRHTWIGDHDLEVDMVVSFAVLAYLALSGFVSLLIALGYILLIIGLHWYLRSRSLAMAAQAPPYGGIIYTALRRAPRYGLLAVVWIIFVVVVTWPRFPRIIIPQFLRGMRDLGQGDDEVGN